MWTSKGRSGYGDSTIGGDYDSWDGISPNGRQYKNEATMETRDLSGADYWHLRKQNRPIEEIPVELHMLKSGKANINAYAVLDEPKKPKKAPLKSRILPQLSRLERLQSEIYELEQGYRAGEYDIEEYSLLRNVLFTKYDRAQVLYKKAISVSRDDVCEQYPEDIPHSSSKTHEYDVEMYSQNSSSYDRVVRQGETESEEIGYGFIDELSEQNFFKNPLKKACRWTRKVIEFSHKAKAYYMTLKEV